MGYAEAQDPNVLAHYEGLIFSTARLLRGHVEDDQEDVRQILRLKVWKAIRAYNPDRSSRT
jgi:DNA-directed RNA polymerase specialized sigma subunit